MPGLDLALVGVPRGAAINFFKHHLGDYDGATAHISWDEDCAYQRLMRAYYRREAPIPDAEKYRLSRAATKAQRAAVDAVLLEFFYREGDFWRQKRCDEEIAAYQAQSDTNRRIARGRTVVRTVQRTVDEPSTKRTPNQIPEPDTRNQEPEKEKSKTLAPDATRRGLKVNGHRIEFDPIKGAFTGISEDQELAWQDAYPAVPIPPAIARAAAWAKENPANRKSNWGRFLVNWFAREQDRAARVRR